MKKRCEPAGYCIPCRLGVYSTCVSNTSETCFESSLPSARRLLNKGTILNYEYKEHFQTIPLKWTRKIGQVSK